jgi:hypothetical protein
MKKLGWFIAMSFCLSLMSNVAYCLDAKNSKDKDAKIVEFIKTVKMDDMIDQQIEAGTDQLIQQYPIFTSHKEEILKLYHEVLNKEDFNKYLVKLFNENFSVEEIQGLISFYQSPTGQKILEKMPVITQSSIAYTSQLLEKNKDKFEALFSKIEKESQDQKQNDKSEETPKKKAHVD